HSVTVLIFVYPSMGHKVDSCNTDLHKLFYTPKKGAVTKWLIILPQALFLLEYSIKGLSNKCIYWFYLKTSKPRFARKLLYSPASPGPSPSEQG
ncbi:MAG: hypothetical protein KH374_08420, partial [Dialister sp.]|uniref:hypothetical protein n=1 Tax=Dialister sp. TaxID=1955814 RepID=UPI00257E9EDB